MEAARLRAQVRASATQQKKKEENKLKGDGASSLAPKAVGKGVHKRKADRKDDRPPKKPSVTVGDKSLKKVDAPQDWPQHK